MSELREEIFKIVKDHYISDEGINEVLDAVIAALPEKADNLKTDDTTERHWFKMGYNSAINRIEEILSGAKS